jgi:hypothetical protein
VEVDNIDEDAMAFALAMVLMVMVVVVMVVVLLLLFLSSFPFIILPHGSSINQHTDTIVGSFMLLLFILPPPPPPTPQLSMFEPINYSFYAHFL